MTTLYTQDDRDSARPDCLPIIGSDIEITATLQGDDVMLWVNKSGIQILRVRLQHGGKDMGADKLFAFSPFSPDLAFKIGDSAGGLERLRRSLGLT